VNSQSLLLAMGIATLLMLVIGFFSLITTKNLIRTLIGLEVLTKASTLAIIAAGYFTGRSALAQALAITLIVVEVVVVVAGVGIVLCLFKHSDSVDASSFGSGKEEER